MAHAFFEAAVVSRRVLPEARYAPNGSINFNADASNPSNRIEMRVRGPVMCWWVVVNARDVADRPILFRVSRLPVALAHV